MKLIRTFLLIIFVGTFFLLLFECSLPPWGGNTVELELLDEWKLGNGPDEWFVLGKEKGLELIPAKGPEAAVVLRMTREGDDGGTEVIRQIDGYGYSLLSVTAMVRASGTDARGYLYATHEGRDRALSGVGYMKGYRWIPKSRKVEADDTWHPVTLLIAKPWAVSTVNLFCTAVGTDGQVDFGEISIVKVRSENNTKSDFGSTPYSGS